MYAKSNTMYHKLLKRCKCFMSTQVKREKEFKWIEPVGTDTGIKLYNTVTKTKVPLILRREGFLTWYMCGPTVYDSAHIGHAIAYVKSDIIQRILSDYFNIHTLVIMGITDIDDKIIRRSIKEGKDYRELSRFYEKEFFDDMRKLNVKAPYLSCRVTEYIPQIIKFISDILAKGGAYVASNGSVYFDIMSYNSYNKYGKLSTPFADSTTHPNKRTSLDFALWKAAKDNEPYWESPWGRGRPGWHIECSAMASAIFGKTIDIHSGGIDLIFPHHENEEAQSCCYHTVEQWVNYWLHSGHLCLNDIKMSKSLQNTISIQQFLKKHTANHMRMLCLLSNYRNNIIYSDEVIDHAVNITNKIENFINECNNYVTGKLNSGNIDEAALIHNLHETKQIVHMALTNDFNTAQALHAIIKLVNIGNKMLFENHSIHNDKGTAAIAAVSVYISNILSCFGISQSTSTMQNQNIKDIIEHFVEFRSAVRNRALEQKPRDEVLLLACDTVRKNLHTCGIVVKDRKDLSTWAVQINS
ncbi:hypothetical protein KPH14_004913 [Odynerus spinipes]|uniref:cysteine--tRNA ligase n=1 Tax=Odynerus spinipes TaxID=1348599 RepID=A0AAD9VPT4_9HYME|nr:hypothetical protein KPH14_004913 [Odynerus spinipes]